MLAMAVPGGPAAAWHAAPAGRRRRRCPAVPAARQGSGEAASSASLTGGGLRLLPALSELLPGSVDCIFCFYIMVRRPFGPQEPAGLLLQAGKLGAVSIEIIFAMRVTGIEIQQGNHAAPKIPEPQKVAEQGKACIAGWATHFVGSDESRFSIVSQDRGHHMWLQAAPWRSAGCCRLRCCSSTLSNTSNCTAGRGL